ncbi:hypothetical protein [Microbispora sp. CA-102843]
MSHETLATPVDGYVLLEAVHGPAPYDTGAPYGIERARRSRPRRPEK